MKFIKDGIIYEPHSEFVIEQMKKGGYEIYVEETKEEVVEVPKEEAKEATREKKKKKTPEDVARQNYWRRCRELRRIMELNFGGGDFHVILTCRKDERPSEKVAPKVIRKFRDELRKAYKKQGWELKYIII